MPRPRKPGGHGLLCPRRRYAIYDHTVGVGVRRKRLDDPHNKYQIKTATFPDGLGKPSGNVVGEKLRTDTTRIALPNHAEKRFAFLPKAIRVVVWSRSNQFKLNNQFNLWGR